MKKIINSKHIISLILSVMMLAGLINIPFALVDGTGFSDVADKIELSSEIININGETVFDTDINDTDKIVLKNDSEGEETETTETTEETKTTEEEPTEETETTEEEPTEETAGPKTDEVLLKGEGTELSPYEIGTAEETEWINKDMPEESVIEAYGDDPDLEYNSQPPEEMLSEDITATDWEFSTGSEVLPKLKDVAGQPTTVPFEEHGIILPVTGMMGSLPFTITGIIILSGSSVAYLYLKLKRRRAD